MKLLKRFYKFSSSIEDYNLKLNSLLREYKENINLYGKNIFFNNENMNLVKSIIDIDENDINNINGYISKENEIDENTLLKSIKNVEDKIKLFIYKNDNKQLLNVRDILFHLFFLLATAKSIKKLKHSEIDDEFIKNFNRLPESSKKEKLWEYCKNHCPELFSGGFANDLESFDNFQIIGFLVLYLSYKLGENIPSNDSYAYYEKIHDVIAQSAVDLSIPNIEDFIYFCSEFAFDYANKYHINTLAGIYTDLLTLSSVSQNPDKIYDFINDNIYQRHAAPILQGLIDEVCERISNNNLKFPNKNKHKFLYEYVNEYMSS